MSKDIVFNLGKLFLFTELSSKDFIFISANVNSSNVLDLKESSTFKSSTDITFNLFKFIFNEFNLWTLFNVKSVKLGILPPKVAILGIFFIINFCKLVEFIFIDSNWLLDIVKFIKFVLFFKISSSMVWLSLPTRKLKSVNLLFPDISILDNAESFVKVTLVKFVFFNVNEFIFDALFGSSSITSSCIFWLLLIFILVLLLPNVNFFKFSFLFKISFNMVWDNLLIFFKFNVSSLLLLICNFSIWSLLLKSISVISSVDPSFSMKKFVNFVLCVTFISFKLFPPIANIFRSFRKETFNSSNLFPVTTSHVKLVLFSKLILVNSLFSIFKYAKFSFVPKASSSISFILLFSIPKFINLLLLFKFKLDKLFLPAYKSTKFVLLLTVKVFNPQFDTFKYVNFVFDPKSIPFWFNWLLDTSK